MSLTVTIALTLLFAGLAVVCGWAGARPPNLVRGPRLMPWRLLMLAAAATTVLLIVHIANLVGLETGGGQYY